MRIASKVEPIYVRGFSRQSSWCLLMQFHADFPAYPGVLTSDLGETGKRGFRESPMSGPTNDVEHRISLND